MLKACRQQRRALLSSAVVNIKKSSGKTASDRDDLLTYVERDCEFIKRQIEIINPDVVLCGGTWPLVQPLWPDARRIYDRVWAVQSKHFIDLYHPAALYPHYVGYYALACLLHNSAFENN